MGRYRSASAAEIAAAQVRAQASLVSTARELRAAADAALEAVDPAAPFAAPFAAESSEMLAAADRAAGQMRRSVARDLAGVYSHDVLAEILGRSRWWVGSVIRGERGGDDA